MENSVKDFVSVNNWFQEKYKVKSDSRYVTFKTALNIFLQQHGSIIVETGCLRMPEDYGGGYSTYIFGDFCAKYGSYLYTVDNVSEHLKVCREVTAPFAHCINYSLEDSITFLRSFKDTPYKIDLLYLDSYDCPIEGDATASQKHQLKEFTAALPTLSPHALLLLDDNNFPNGGKTLLTKEALLDSNTFIVDDKGEVRYKGKWICLFDYQQSLWMKTE